MKCATWQSAIDSLIRRMRADGLTSSTIRHYRFGCRIVAERLVGIDSALVRPQDVKRVHVTTFLQQMRSTGLSVATMRDYLTCLRKLCSHCGNPVVDSIHPIWSQDLRQNVDWLSEEDAVSLLNSTMLTAKERVIITLMLCMGLRRIEVIRLRLTDIHPDTITVHGKGHGDGKLRTVPFHPRFKSALDGWMRVRADLLAGSGYRDDALIVYRQGRNLYGYSQMGSAIDNLVRTATSRAGHQCSSHTLRRTFARAMWHAGVPVETIARILGHSNTVQTLRYIGANLDDMTDAMQKLVF